MSEKKKLKIAFLWHMHQPFYFDPQRNEFAMPWVRLHALKDYLDMPLMAAEHDIKATFNLVPSLLDQIELYCNGYTDRHQYLSRIPPMELTYDQKKEILLTFFSAHYPTMIEPYTRYRQLYRKYESCGTDIRLAVNIFSSTEIRDLQVWSNLVWIDPMFREDPPVSHLIRKERDFTEGDKAALLDFQIELMKKIIPAYQDLNEKGNIEVSFTPYYHPILPLLIDNECAREAINDIVLPENHFKHPEDARWHIKESIKKYSDVFGGKLRGMWPSEGSVSEEMLKIIAEYDLKWIATDEAILQQSFLKSGKDSRSVSACHPFSFDIAPDVLVFFRNHALSDKIGFVYSDWDAEKAVSDFIKNICSLKTPPDGVIPIILDGENAWEYFPDDGIRFLRLLYRTLNDDERIEIITLDEAAETLQPIKVSRLFAGSWINHNFRIWIGHKEDNCAWDLLYNARKTLTEYEKNNPGVDPEKIQKAWKQIYIAEGSDWCWWYGDDHLGSHNKEFDKLYRLHIAAVYRILGLEVPSEVLKPIHQREIDTFTSQPESLITPEIDGFLTHYYEWSGAGNYDCWKVGGAMHRVEVIAKSIYFAYDYESFYIRLDFAKDIDLIEKGNFKAVIDFVGKGKKEIKLEPTFQQTGEGFIYSFRKILEIGFPRKAILENGYGELEFNILLYSGSGLLEKWPIDEPIKVVLPEKDKEIFWQV